MTSTGIVIAGGGRAGQRAAETLRRYGYDGLLALAAARTVALVSGRRIPFAQLLIATAHGDCALAAPGVFTIEDIAIVTGRGADDGILASARACPAGAITVTGADTGEPLYA